MRMICVSAAQRPPGIYKIELLDLRGEKIGVLHYPHSPNMLIDPVMSRGVNRAGTLKFNISVEHPYYEYIADRQCYLRVWRDGRLIFECRPIPPITRADGIKSVTCEGALAYLNDTIQWRKTYHDTSPAEYLQDKIDWHNARIGDDDPMRQFTSVDCTVTNSTDNVYRQDNDLPNTLTNIRKKLVERLGGYVDVTYTVMTEEGGNGNVVSQTVEKGLEYIPDLPKLEGQEVRAGVNLLSCETAASSDDFYTVLIPQGATLEGSDYPLDIQSVNDNHTFVECADGVAQYGRIWAVKTWQDVTDAANLKEKAQADVDSQLDRPESITVSAADLYYSGDSDAPLEYGHKIYVADSADGVSGWFDCTDEEIHIADPSQNTYTLGCRRSSITQLAGEWRVKYGS
ncbi:phage tail protein [Butyricicoccus porcorum]|uniref:Tail spike domain-containing protein n=1 Tax=Butyricicoccus porcorum TaxID=1945634 RepID=A0A252F2H1_9FIRM|nr:phage tail protein [Butyricicoccus porcorum]OUM19997.1 hypothetical protein CBW42_09645 [Butyricicoccus porcorum]